MRLLLILFVLGDAIASIHQNEDRSSINIFSKYNNQFNDLSTGINFVLKQFNHYPNCNQSEHKVIPLCNTNSSSNNQYTNDVTWTTQELTVAQDISSILYHLHPMSENFSTEPTHKPITTNEILQMLQTYEMEIVFTNHMSVDPNYFRDFKDSFILALYPTETQYSIKDDIIADEQYSKYLVPVHVDLFMDTQMVILNSCRINSEIVLELYDYKQPNVIATGYGCNYTMEHAEFIIHDLDNVKYYTSPTPENSGILKGLLEIEMSYNTINSTKWTTNEPIRENNPPANTLNSLIKRLFNTTFCFIILGTLLILMQHCYYDPKTLHTNDKIDRCVIFIIVICIGCYRLFGINIDKTNEIQIAESAYIQKNNIKHINVKNKHKTPKSVRSVPKSSNIIKKYNGNNDIAILMKKYIKQYNDNKKMKKYSIPVKPTNINEYMNERVNILYKELCEYSDHTNYVGMCEWEHNEETCLEFQFRTNNSGNITGERILIDSAITINGNGEIFRDVIWNENKNEYEGCIMFEWIDKYNNTVTKLMFNTNENYFDLEHLYLEGKCYQYSDLGDINVENKFKSNKSKSIRKGIFKIVAVAIKKRDLLKRNGLLQYHEIDDGDKKKEELEKVPKYIKCMNYTSVKMQQLCAQNS